MFSSSNSIDSFHFRRIWRNYYSTGNSELEKAIRYARVNRIKAEIIVTKIKFYFKMLSRSYCVYCRFLKLKSISFRIYYTKCSKCVRIGRSVICVGFSQKLLAKNPSALSCTKVRTCLLFEVLTRKDMSNTCEPMDVYFQTKLANRQLFDVFFCFFARIIYLI